MLDREDYGCVFARSPPLRVLELAPLHVSSKIKIYLDEPLLQKIDMKKLAASCAFADVLLQMDQKNNAAYDFERTVLPEILELCQEIDSSRPYMSILRESGILDCFPNLRKYLDTIKTCGVRKNFKVNNESSGSKNYLSYVALLNELLTMSSQLHEDIDHPQNHKYMAHQVALLYQCINHVKGEVRPLKKPIEERFNGLKNLVESNSSGGSHLTDFYKTWLRDLTSDIRAIVSSFPPDVVSNVDPLGKSLKWTSTMS